MHRTLSIKTIVEIVSGGITGLSNELNLCDQIVFLKSVLVHSVACEERKDEKI